MTASNVFEFASMYELRAAVFMLDKPSAVSLTVRKNTVWNVLVLTYCNADGERFTNEFDCGHTRADALEAYADAYRAAQAYAQSANVRAAQDAEQHMTQAEQDGFILLATGQNGATLYRHEDGDLFACCRSGRDPQHSDSYRYATLEQCSAVFLSLCYE